MNNEQLRPIQLTHIRAIMAEAAAATMDRTRPATAIPLLHPAFLALIAKKIPTMPSASPIMAGMKKKPSNKPKKNAAYSQDKAGDGSAVARVIAPVRRIVIELHT